MLFLLSPTITYYFDVYIVYIPYSYVTPLATTMIMIASCAAKQCVDIISL